MRILVTGGAGFIGSHFVRHMISLYPSYSFVTLDALTYAANLDNLESVRGLPNHRFVRGSICDGHLVGSLLEQGVDAVVNFAAESHVDRSIKNAHAFIETNITGTVVLLEEARKHNVRLFIQISTDEVYGSLGAYGAFTESSPLQPNNPYAASKTAADLLALSYYKTHNLPVIITRSSNNFGPNQHPEKLIPKMVLKAISNKPLPVYGDGRQIRDWLYVEDNCRAIERVLHRGEAGEVYNIGSNNECVNIKLVAQILNVLGKPVSLIQFVDDRPGHDRRYAIDSTKIKRELGWQPVVSLEEGLKKTIRWYQENLGRLGEDH